MLFVVLALGFLAMEFLGYGIHRAMHWRWTGPIWRAHLTHHHLYAKHPLSDNYLMAGAHAAPRYYVMAALPIVAALFVLLPFVYALALTVEMAALGALNDAVHDASHVRGHWMERFGWFRRLRAQHQVHHRHANRNYGLLTLIPDHAVGSYADPRDC